MVRVTVGVMVTVGIRVMGTVISRRLI